MEFYKYERDGREGILSFPASVWLNNLTETELLGFSRSSTQIIVDTSSKPQKITKWKNNGRLAKTFFGRKFKIVISDGFSLDFVWCDRFN